MLTCHIYADHHVNVSFSHMLACNLVYNVMYRCMELANIHRNINTYFFLNTLGTAIGIDMEFMLFVSVLVTNATVLSSYRSSKTAQFNTSVHKGSTVYKNTETFWTNFTCLHEYIPCIMGISNDKQIMRYTYILKPLCIKVSIW